MKIICTKEDKDWIFPLLLNSDRCPAAISCNGRTCEQCLNEEIEWIIEPLNDSLSEISYPQVDGITPTVISTKEIDITC